MKEKLIESVINVSEARNEDVIYLLEDTLQEEKALYHLHTERNYSANRSVFSFAASPSIIEDSTFKFIKVATDLIDMEKHKGVHPRIGAVDVVPFIPLYNTTMQEAIIVADNVAKRVAKELKIPVYLYGENATSLERYRVPFIRKGEYEGLEKRMKEGFIPDYGPISFNKKSGATIIGARGLMVAYNINLKSTDLEAAKAIAAHCRTQKSFLNNEAVGGLFEGLQAKGWFIEEYNCVQITTNIHNLNATSLHALYESIKKIAKKYNQEVNGSELIGLVPKEYLLQSGYFYNHNKEIEKDIRLSNKLNKNEQELLIDKAIKNLGLNSVVPFNPNLQIIESVLML